mmetsp:Transcript_63704/g.114673  ORF Transcript_63704/g.114673 Transcript_63704/m.114673 type:complete len:95 (-) Transcript_63704:290-574(-)
MRRASGNADNAQRVATTSAQGDPASQIDLGAVWTECRTADPTPALLDASIETNLPPAADGVEANGSSSEVFRCLVLSALSPGRRSRRFCSKLHL